MARLWGSWTKHWQPSSRWQSSSSPSDLKTIFMDLWRRIRNVENGSYLGTNSIVYSRPLNQPFSVLRNVIERFCKQSTSTIFLDSHRKSHWSTLWISYPSPITLLFVVLRKGLKTFHIQSICFLYNKHKLYWFPRSRKFVKLCRSLLCVCSIMQWWCKVGPPRNTGSRDTCVGAPDKINLDLGYD